jgi:hypothetical protein
MMAEGVTYIALTLGTMAVLIGAMLRLYARSPRRFVKKKWDGRWD